MAPSRETARPLGISGRETICGYSPFLCSHDKEWNRAREGGPRPDPESARTGELIICYMLVGWIEMGRDHSTNAARLGGLSTHAYLRSRGKTSKSVRSGIGVDVA